MGLLILTTHGFAQTGNVGIGTQSPEEKLHVAGAIRSDSLAGSGRRLLGTDSLGTLQVVNLSEFIQLPDSTLLRVVNEAGGLHWLSDADQGLFQVWARDTLWYQRTVHGPLEETWQAGSGHHLLRSFDQGYEWLQFGRYQEDSMFIPARAIRTFTGTLSGEHILREYVEYQPDNPSLPAYQMQVNREVDGAYSCKEVWYTEAGQPLREQKSYPDSTVQMVYQGENIWEKRKVEPGKTTYTWHDNGKTQVYTVYPRENIEQRSFSGSGEAPAWYKRYVNNAGDTLRTLIDPAARSWAVEGLLQNEGLTIKSPLADHRQTSGWIDSLYRERTLVGGRVFTQLADPLRSRVIWEGVNRLQLPEAPFQVETGEGQALWIGPDTNWGFANPPAAGMALEGLDLRWMEAEEVFSMQQSIRPIPLFDNSGQVPAWHMNMRFGDRGAWQQALFPASDSLFAWQMTHEEREWNILFNRNSGKIQIPQLDLDPILQQVQRLLP